jgi:hypothetical protein
MDMNKNSNANVKLEEKVTGSSNQTTRALSKMVSSTCQRFAFVNSIPRKRYRTFGSPESWDRYWNEDTFKLDGTTFWPQFMREYSDCVKAANNHLAKRAMAAATPASNAGKQLNPAH